MPLSGEYEPSPIDRVREQVELYEATWAKIEWKVTRWWRSAYNQLT
jgi:hypothetical protein